MCTPACGGTATTTTVTPASAGGAAATDPTGATPTTPPSPTTPSPTPAPDPSAGTSSGGFVWTAEASGRAQPVTAIWGSGPGDVWAAGGHGVVHSTGDGAWTTVHEDAGESYDAVIGAHGNVFVGGASCPGGVCEGGVLLQSSDGGATWSSRALGSYLSDLALGGDTVYAASGDLYASSDGFATTTTLPLGWAASNGVFADGGTLYATGGLRTGELRRSADGGQSWQSVWSGAYGSQSSSTAGVARGGATLFALANGCSVPACVGALLRSADGGATWTEASRPQDYVVGVWAASDNEVFVGGSALARSTDGGATFTKVTLPHDTTILALWGASANELYAVGQDGTIFHGKR